MGPADLIAVSAIVVGFGVTVIMFRVTRELQVRHELGEEMLWVPWADRLIIGSVFLAVFGATVPLVVVPNTPQVLVALAASSCVAALILQAGYIPSILAHYRIEFGTNRLGKPTEKGEPIERQFVIGSVALAAALFGVTLLLRLIK